MIIPFVYFYLLSFAVIFVAAYWIATSPGNINTTYARTNQNTNEISISLSASENKSYELIISNSCEAHPSTNKIDTFFTNRGAPLAGEGCNFVEHAKENGLSNYLVAAISWCESNGGKVTPNFGGIESYNAWGWAVYDSNELTRSVNGYGCDSWEECIGRVSRGIARNSAQRSLGVEPEEIVLWYTPASVEKGNGDPLQAPWTKCVEQMMRIIENTKVST